MKCSHNAISSRLIGKAKPHHVRPAAAEQLDDATATRLFTRILLVLRSHDGTAGDETRQRIAAEVAAEVAKIVSDRKLRAIELVERNGLKPVHVYYQHPQELVTCDGCGTAIKFGEKAFRVEVNT